MYIHHARKAVFVLSLGLSLTAACAASSMSAVTMGKAAQQTPESQTILTIQGQASVEAAGPGMPAPTLPKGSGGKLTMVVAGPGMPAPTLPKGSGGKLTMVVAGPGMPAPTLPKGSGGKLTAA